MNYITFEKNQLVNLEYSLTKEIIRTSREGAYSSSTIINCNTRKYHGLLVMPQPAIDEGNHVLLSTFDETVIQHNAEFNLAIHKYQGDVYSPKGHKYLKDFTADPIPKLSYHVGGVELTKEMLFSNKDGRIIIKYTLVEAHSPTRIRFKPFLAFRNIHALTRSNYDVDTSYESIDNGIKLRMYRGYSFLHLQFSKEPEYVHVPDWYYNVEYSKEKRRGYNYLEDLYVPGYFEMAIEKGESIYFSAGVEPIATSSLARVFKNEISKKTPRDSFEHCLMNAAQQFIVRRGKKMEIISGYPWFGRWGRDTFVALPGLTLVTGDYKTAKAVLDTMVQELKGPLFPNMGIGEKAIYNSADTPLWFFWALQQYGKYTKTTSRLWQEYGKYMKAILYGYREGTSYNIKLHDNNLIYSGAPGFAVTWMDAIVDGKPVTPRIGYCVEINALWYNALNFALQLATQAEDHEFIRDWQEHRDAFPEAFIKNFWDERRGYLADYTNGDYKDFSVRPNQVLATSLPYTPLPEEMRNSILERVKSELLTPRGLRSLAPKNVLYKGVYEGNQAERDHAYHQGSVHPWLLGHFVEGFLTIHQTAALQKVKEIYYGFEDEMKEHGIGTISEVYDGDPPNKGAGAISQAWCVAEVLRIGWLIKQYEKPVIQNVDSASSPKKPVKELKTESKVTKTKEKRTK